MADRRQAILEAALSLLERGGLQALTTAALAREAKCSKETIYLLFKDRDDILGTLVAEQSARLNGMLEGIDGDDPLDALTEAGARLLDLLTSDASLAINRAALGDPTGSLSRILIEAGRNRTAPLFIRLLEQARLHGRIGFTDGPEAFRTFYGLLIADRQITALHRVEGARPQPDERRILAERAVHGLAVLLPPQPVGRIRTL
ncbi:TetR/AcrR family transcriptional regulator [Microvirga sp. CF3016]|uniref:TetR/AcrR family transcriptional regulator n=1 Tax=Microvirga sp. CF3016 TaxID=3110181 RepID=UPI002E760A1A|nr:TetR/AcrR family transcriptional regulator [Microvirga sp. CF3016]MEE1610608.1 TetR/AcrR family transcriptional regulator [Microvirga sp. CF3016]